MVKIDIQILLPQQPPFIMVDSLTHFDNVITRTQLQVRHDNIFVENGEFVETGIIENIAQTCALLMGYINKFLVMSQISYSG